MQQGGAISNKGVSGPQRLSMGEAERQACMIGPCAMAFSLRILSA